jgi:hypothetical protein
VGGCPTRDAAMSGEVRVLGGDMFGRGRDVRNERVKATSAPSG